MLGWILGYFAAKAYWDNEDEKKELMRNIADGISPSALNNIPKDNRWHTLDYMLRYATMEEISQFVTRGYISAQRVPGYGKTIMYRRER